MKTITVTIDVNYTDGRKDGQYSETGPLSSEGNFFSTKHLSSYIGYKHIDFQTGDILIDGDVTLHSGVPHVVDEGFVIHTITYVMEDDGVPCNENTLDIYLECNNSENGERQSIYIPYQQGIVVQLTPHPYTITVLELNNEEVTLEVKDDEKTTKHLVQLYNFASRNDEHYYATGNPNDPVDTIGPILYMHLLRKKTK